jgi:hypothetical protein
MLNYLVQNYFELDEFNFLCNALRVSDIFHQVENPISTLMLSGSPLFRFQILLDFEVMSLNHGHVSYIIKQRL